MVTLEKKLKKLYKWLKPCVQSACHTAVGVLGSATLFETVDWHFIFSTTTLAFFVAVLTKYSDASEAIKKK